MKQDILFSIIVPTYNRPKLLKRSLKRILSSKYQNFEIIVVNDGGTQESEKVIKSLGSDKIQYFWKKNEQKSIAKNFGFTHAKGDYFLSFDDDDIMYEDFLDIAYNNIIKNNYPDLYYQGYEIVDINENYISTPAPIESTELDIFSNCPFSNNGMFLKKEICELPLYLPRSDLTLSADWLLWIKLLSKYQCVINNEVTHGVTVHQKRGSSSANVQQYEKNLHIFENELKSNNWGTQSQINKTIGHYNTYISLYLTLADKKAKGLKYLLRGIGISPKEIFTRRFLAIIKHMFINHSVNRK